MAPNLRTAVAPLTALLLVLIMVLALRARLPVGLAVTIPSRSAYPPGTRCIAQRIVIVRVEARGELRINHEPVTHRTLPQRLKEIFSSQSERVAFVFGEPETTYGDVVEVMEMVSRAVDHVGLLTTFTVPTPNEPLLRDPLSSEFRSNR